MRTRDSKVRFSIRKLTVGAVSVMFGALIFGITTSQAKADTTSSAPAQTEQQTGNNSSSTSTQTADTDSDAIEASTGLDQSTSATTRTDSNGVQSSVEVSATNKNTGNTSSVKGITHDAGLDQTATYGCVDKDNAENINATFTITNPTDKAQTISGQNYWVSLPAWNGTNALYLVDSSRVNKDANGNLVFGGNYSEAGLTLTSFSLANSSVGSTGYGQTIESASADPSKVAGFMITGTLAAGQTATIVVPLIENANSVNQSRARVEYYFSTGLYIGDKVTQKINYVYTDPDTGNETTIASQNVVGIENATVAVPALPAGSDYFIFAGQPNKTTLSKKTMDDLTIHVGKNETKSVTETIHYVYSDGRQAAADNTQTLTFSRSQTFADGKTAWTAWTPANDTFAAVQSPVIAGYTADQTEIAVQKVTGDSADIVKTVTYNANVQPTEPTQPTTPSDSGDQTAPVLPEEPTDTSSEDNAASDNTETVRPHAQDDETAATSKKAAKPAKAVKIAAVKAVKANSAAKSVKVTKAAKASLPQTSAKKSDAGLIGLAVAALGLFGLAGVRKRKED